VYNYNTHII